MNQTPERVDNQCGNALDGQGGTDRPHATGSVGNRTEELFVGGRRDRKRNDGCFLARDNGKFQLWGGGTQGTAAGV